MFSKSKPAGSIAVCLYPDRVDVASATMSAMVGTRPVLQMLESYERGSDDFEALKRLSKQHNLGRSSVITLLPAMQYQVVSVEAPNVPKAEIKEAVRWQIKDLIDYPVEQATIDVMEVPTAASGRPATLLAVAAKNEVVERLMRSFNSSGAGLEVIDIYEMAQRNIAALCEEKDRGLAMLSFDNAGGYLTFTYQAELYLSRHIDISSHQLLDAGRQTQLFERIGLELQRSTDGFERQFSHIPLTKLVLAPSPFAELLRGFLADYLTMPVSVLDLAQVMDIAAIPSLNAVDRQGQCFATIGAALRPASSLVRSSVSGSVSAG
jgi:MSHA biogenesis protein MshI